MRAKVSISNSEANKLNGEVFRLIEKHRGEIEYAMALSFLNCILENFGPTGLYRPWSGWPPLSPAYAKKVGRTYATLEVSGRLKDSILIDATGKNFAVTAEDSRVPYSTAHQLGLGNMPQREYFPMDDDGTVTRQVQDIVQDAAERKLEELLR